MRIFWVGLGKLFALAKRTYIAIFVCTFIRVVAHIFHFNITFIRTHLLVEEIGHSVCLFVCDLHLTAAVLCVVFVLNSKRERAQAKCTQVKDRKRRIRKSNTHCTATCNECAANASRKKSTHYFPCIDLIVWKRRRRAHTKLCFRVYVMQLFGFSFRVYYCSSNSSTKQNDTAIFE